MQDQYAGKAGTFVNDPDKGVRVPLEQWEAEQEAKAKAEAGKPKTKGKQEPQPETQQLETE
jgi:hypothetical protein